ncbi:MAG TPA: NAD(P)-binding domain-containing protein [Ignavibacteria bacterium]|nr:NAD(P)-binding domain-containing protein [Ignavibacteria bacterium]HMQ98482.1 NAD(P)-binding domain-containing protein [Ignavibacteria bacterium]
MKIGILGSGAVGKALAIGFTSEGNEVMLGTRDPKASKITEWLTGAGKGITAGTFDETAKFGEMIVLCPLYRAIDEVIELAGKKNFEGKIVIDTTNPIAEEPPVNGVLKYVKIAEGSAGEHIQSMLPNSHVVKAFNSIGSGYMYKPKFDDGQPTMFICGNNEEAKNEVTGILEKFGWEVMDSGGIEASNALEGLCIIWCARGFREGQWNHAFKLLKK